MSQSLGYQIRQARKQRGITQEELAKNVPVSRQTVSSWENDRTQPDYETLKKVAQILAVDVGLLIDGKKSGDESEKADVVTLDASKNTALPEPAQTEEAERSEPPTIRKDWSAQIHFIPKVVLSAMILVMLLGVSVVWLMIPRVNAPGLEWYMEGNERRKDACYLEIYSPDTPAVAYAYPPGSDPCWSFRVFILEKGGVGYEIQNASYISYEKNWLGRVIPNERFPVSPLQLERNVGKGIIGPGQVRAFQISLAAKQSLAGAGVIVETLDANGNEQTFRLYVPFEEATE